MGVVPFNKSRGPEKTGAPRTTLQRIVRALDHLVARRRQRVVPAIALRRSDRDVRRCRQLVLQRANDRHVSVAWPRTS